MLQNHDPQQNPNPTGWPPTRAISCRNKLFSLGEVYHAANGFQNGVDGPSLSNRQVKKRHLGISFSLHAHLSRSTSICSKTFAEISLQG
jgi:hypothetical protein